MTATVPTVDFAAIKARQRGTWSSGNYAVIGTALQITGELLNEAADVSAGERVLDVAAGNGNASLAAARRGALVTAADYVPTLLERTAARAAAEGLSVETREADAEALPFAGATYDVVLSTFGVMFAPNQERAAAELVRVTRPGGRIAIANWTPDGFVGQMFKIVGKYAPPPAGIRSPLEWGTEARVGELFGTSIEAIGAHRRQFVWRYRSAAHWLNTFRDYYGPMYKAFESLDTEGRAAMQHDLLTLANEHNTSGAGAIRIPSEYLEVVAVKAR